MKTRALVIVVAFIAGLIAYPHLTAQTRARRVIHAERVPKTGLPYSPAILAGDTLSLAGQLGRDPKTTQLVSGGIEAETRQVMTNVREVLREGGMDFGDVASVTAFIVDFKDFDTFNRVYREYFPKDQPARAT